MKKVAAIILENNNGDILLYLRDNKPGIPFPHHWDLFGGHLEDGETPEEALVRELKEELDLELTNYTFYKTFECLTGDTHPNIKYVFAGKINIPLNELKLQEGERLRYFTRNEIPEVNFANILKDVVMDFIRSTQ